ncbi:MAG: hypothetical protein JO029_11650 [Candidatus Eremiobacteraeota bacterium]|nr:hypothetical protein [Candidatus Eremiobacteraeota bacterium]MBV8434923.1 hypothetical protein [Candidatus Eremiobacteraeota bacterium]MBV8583140.1 hypothetical protein [Candidatus Eremiobacteraeota bacterium]
MDRIDASEAREHIEMVAQILADTEQRLCAGGEFFVVWGLFSGCITLLVHFVSKGALAPQAIWIGAALFVGALVFSVWRGRALRASVARRSLVQREFFNVLWLTLGLAFVANVALFNIFSGIASAAIWSFAEAIVLLYIGMHGNRRAQVCGITVVVSMVVANFTRGDVTAYALAAGMIAGYGGFGVAELLTPE